MRNAFLVGIGGFVGSALRYALGGWVTRLRLGWTFPIETLVINVAGCVAIGAFMGLVETRGILTPGARVFLFVGVLGGFTTFSTFGYETFQLLRGGQWGAATLSITLQIVLGIGGVWAGHAAAIGARWP